MTFTDRREESHTSSVARKALISPCSDWLSKTRQIIDVSVNNVFYPWSVKMMKSYSSLMKWPLLLLHTDRLSRGNVSGLFSCPWLTAAFRRTPHALCTAGARPKVGCHQRPIVQIKDMNSILEPHDKNVFFFSGTGHEGTLKRVYLPIVSNERCQQLHRGSLPITRSKLCAGGRKDEGVCEVRFLS